MFKKTLSNSFLYGLGNHLPKIINFLMLPVLTPFLTSKDYGVFGILAAYIASLTAFKALGTTVLLSNSFYKHKIGNRYKFVWERIYGFLSLWSVLLSFIFALLIYLVLPLSEERYIIYIMLAYSIPVAFFDTTVLMGSKYFQYKQVPLPYALITFISSVTGIAVNYICIVHYGLGYIGWVISMFTVSLISFVCFFYFLFFKYRIRPLFSFNYNWLKKKLIIALPTIPHFYGTYLLTSADRIILDWYRLPVKEIGLYNLAYTFGGYFAIVGQSLGLAIGPILMSYLVKETYKSEVEMRRFTFVLQGALLVFAFIVALWIKEIYSIFIKNTELQSGYTFAAILIMSYTYYPLYFAVNTKLQYMEKTKYLWRITFVGALINIVLNLALIPLLGVLAAAVSTFGCLLFLGVSGYFIKEYRLNSKVKYYPLQWASLSIILTVLVYYLIEINSYYKLLLSLALMVGVMVYVLKERQKEKLIGGA